MTTAVVSPPGGGDGGGGDGGGGDGERPRWSPAVTAAAALACAHDHAAGGRLDESARRLSHEEYTVARLLESEGHDVRSVPESRRAGPTPDLMVCGTAVEVKSFAARADRRRQPNPQSVVNKLLSARHQASHVVLVGHGSDLSPATARLGLARYAGLRRADAALTSVRVIGDGYDVAWTRSPVPAAARHPDAPGRRPAPVRSPGPGREPGP